MKCYASTFFSYNTNKYTKYHLNHFTFTFEYKTFTFNFLFYLSSYTSLIFLSSFVISYTSSISFSFFHFQLHLSSVFSLYENNFFSLMLCIIILFCFVAIYIWHNHFTFTFHNFSVSTKLLNSSQLPCFHYIVNDCGQGNMPVGYLKSVFGIPTQDSTNALQFSVFPKMNSVSNFSLTFYYI